MSETRRIWNPAFAFLYDPERNWWTAERYEERRTKPALDPVRRSVNARRKRNEETGLPL